MREPSNWSHTIRILSRSGVVLPRLAEYAYYGLIVYGVMAPTYGISIPLLGAGGMGFLAVCCFWQLRKKAASIYAPLFLPIGCAVSFLLVQLVVHEKALMTDTNRGFVNWIIALIIVQSLFSREGFLHRFGAGALAIGLLQLPYLDFDSGNTASDPVERAGLQQGVGFANPNQLAGWFGFCCLYFIVLAIETRRNIVRILSSLAAFGCLFVVGLTVSRGALLGIAIGVVITFRQRLERGFLPLLLLTVLGGGIFYSGVFDRAMGFYTERGAEDTGRLSVWPLAFARFLDAPLVGVGGEDSDIMIDHTTPHNSFLYLGLASGIIPLAFYVTYWIKVLLGAYRLSGRGLQDAPFQLPLVIYSLIAALLGATDFMFYFAVVTLCNAIPRPSMYHITAVDVDKSRAIKFFGERLKTSYAIPGRRQKR